MSWHKSDVGIFFAQKVDTVKAILAGLFSFGVVLAVKIGYSMTADAAWLLGILVGVVASVPVCVVLVMLHRLNQGVTARNLAGLARTQEYQSPIAYSGRVGPSVTLTGHSTRPFADAVTLRHYVDRGRDGLLIEGQYREYGFAAPVVTRGSTTVRTYKRNRLGPGAATVGSVEITNTVPHHAPAASSDVFVPLAQAVITAFVGALVVGVVALTAGRGDVLRLVGVAFVGVLAGAWLWRLGVVDSLLSVVERITQEIEGDEEEAEDSAHAMLENPNQARQTAGRIAGEHAGAIKTAELLSFLTRCAVVGTSEGKLGIGTSPQARAKYAALRDALIDLGIGEWRDPNRRAAGWLLTMTPEQAAPIISRHVKELRAG